MSAAIARRFVKKRSFNVDACDDSPGQFIFLAQLAQRSQATDHRIERGGDDGGENSTNAIGAQSLAGQVELIGAQRVGVEVNSTVTIHLKVEVTGTAAHAKE